MGREAERSEGGGSKLETLQPGRQGEHESGLGESAKGVAK